MKSKARITLISILLALVLSQSVGSLLTFIELDFIECESDLEEVEKDWISFNHFASHYNSQHLIIGLFLKTQFEYQFLSIQDHSIDILVPPPELKM